jgi:glycosyltransferase involved in cell wall biosynthesis
MSAGAPVIASDIPAVREVCRDAVLYFDPLVPATITEAMRRVIDRSADVDMLRSRAHDRITAFSWRRSALAMVELVRHLTETRAAEGLATR